MAVVSIKFIIRVVDIGKPLFSCLAESGTISETITARLASFAIVRNCTLLASRAAFVGVSADLRTSSASTGSNGSDADGGQGRSHDECLELHDDCNTC